MPEGHKCLAEARYRKPQCGRSEVETSLGWATPTSILYLAEVGPRWRNPLVLFNLCEVGYVVGGLSPVRPPLRSGHTGASGVVPLRGIYGLRPLGWRMICLFGVSMVFRPWGLGHDLPLQGIYGLRILGRRTMELIYAVFLCPKGINASQRHDTGSPSMVGAKRRPHWGARPPHPSSTSQR